MASLTGTNVITHEKLEIGAAEKYVILKGCIDPSLKGGNVYNSLINIDFSLIKNPYSVRNSSPFKMQIYKEYNKVTDVLSVFIAETKTSIIPAAMYTKNIVTGISLAVLDPIVQEASTQTYTFTTKSDMPGGTLAGASSGMMSAIHIFFPIVITKDASNTGSNVIEILVNESSTPITGTPSFTVDTSLNYNELC